MGSSLGNCGDGGGGSGPTAFMLARFTERDFPN